LPNPSGDEFTTGDGRRFRIIGIVGVPDDVGIYNALWKVEPVPRLTGSSARTPVLRGLDLFRPRRDDSLLFVTAGQPGVGRAPSQLGGFHEPLRTLGALARHRHLVGRAVRGARGDELCGAQHSEGQRLEV
jgi:hypothetical protein